VELASRTAVVTGGGAGIGRAIALRFAREGASVVVADLDERAARGTVEEMSRGVAVRVDVTEEDDVRRLIDTAVRTFGSLDVLVNNVGNYDEPAFPDASVEHWMRNLDRNLRSTMLGIHYGLPEMAGHGGGAIVNIASAAGLGLTPYGGPEYAAAKAAVMRLTAALGDHPNVRVNCICPNTVGTDSVRRAIAEGRAQDEPLIELDEIADTAVTFVRDESLAGRVVVLWGGRPPRLLPVLGPADFAGRLA
jgi:NAD(P)-dependent dehydrogenase (short-subunit alcohol dehydrogenase family)